MFVTNTMIAKNEDINEIETNLYLGNLETALNKKIMKKYKIKRILSVIQMKIDVESRIEGINYKHISICDSPVEDIISYFPECFTFISDAQSKGENVYVHCHFGVSRSATIVIAFLMKKYNHSLGDTFQMVRNIRYRVKPNDGFLNQLYLWHQMSFNIMGNNRDYRLVVFEALISKVRLIKAFSEEQDWNTNYRRFVSSFECFLRKISIAESNAQQLNKMKTFLCKCSKELFNEINVIKNDNTSIACQSIFIEPQKWILETIVQNARNINDFITGSIECIECKENLGQFDWYKSDFQSTEEQKMKSSLFLCKCEQHKELDYILVMKIVSNKIHANY